MKVKAVVGRTEATWEDKLRAKDEIVKERFMGIYKMENKGIRCIEQSKKEENGHFGRKMNPKVNESFTVFSTKECIVKVG